MAKQRETRSKTEIEEAKAAQWARKQARRAARKATWAERVAQAIRPLGSDTKGPQ